MWTLSELSKIETDPLRKSVIDTLLLNVDIFQILPWETIGALSTTVVRIKDLPSWGYRKVNSGYSESTGHFEQNTENIALGGLDIDTDKAIARAGNRIAETRAIMQNMALKAFAYSFNDSFINGDPSDTTNYKDQFKGIKVRIDDLAQTYPSQKFACNSTSVGINNSATTALAFIDDLDKLCWAIDGHKPDLLIMNDKALLATKSALRRAGVLSTTTDMFNRQIDMYGTARLISMGTKADQQTEVITSTETTAGLAGGTECTSIYAVKFGIGDQLWGIQEYPMEVADLGELQTAPVYRTRVDFPHGLAQVSPRCVARMYGVIPDTSS
jgi:hypothetical protein